MKHKASKIKYSFLSILKTINKHLSNFRANIFITSPHPGSRGFTLVELLIYSAIFAITVGLLSSILIAITGVQTRESAAFEITRQLQFVTQRMQHTIRDASVIGEVFEGTNPAAPCVQFCSIRLRVANPTLDPTIISSDMGGVYIQEGNNPRVALTTPAAQITALRFRRTANPEGLTTVAVDFGMVLNPDDPQLRVERQLQSGIAHVSAATFNADILPDASGARNIGGTNLRWNNLILSGGIMITAPGTAGDHVGISMERGTTHGSSRIIQYYLPSTPRDRFGQRFEIGDTPILHLEGDMGDTARRAYFLNSNVGIGTNSPTVRLDIDGQIRIRGGAPAAGRVLTTDATGLATWADPVAGGGGGGGAGLPAGTASQTIRHDGTAWIATSAIWNDGINVGIGTPSPATRLDVAGTVRMTGFQLGTTATAGHVLTANASGVGTWAAAGGITWPLLSTADGTAAAPTYSWSADTNMGIRRGGVDDLRLVTAGVDRVVVDATGRVGIGAASPTARLVVLGEGATSATQALNVTNSAGTSSFFVRDDGNVGVGTTAPVSNLTVRRATAGTAFAIRNTTDTANTFTITDAGVAQMTGFQLGTTATAGHVLTANASGVGTWAAAGGITWPLLSTADGTVAAPTYSWSADTNMGIRRGGVDDLRLVTAGVDRVVVDATGRVGVGTATPTAQFVVQGDGVLLLLSSAAGNGSFTFGTDAVAHPWFGTSSNHNLRLITNNTERIRIDTAGNVGIGTVTPTRRLDVAGEVIANAYFHHSDRALKTDIEPIRNSLQRVLGLEPAKFNWKNDGGVSLGFIAQNVEQEFPELVSTDAQGSKSVNYSGLVAPLVQALQEQQLEINQLRAEIEKLR